MEKYLIRRAFADSGLLPKEVLWRKKEAFSDGVSKHARSLYLILQEYADSFSFDAHCLARQVMHCPPKTKEQLYYRQLFEEAYPGQGKVVPHFWMPKYVTATDASARTLSEYQKSHTTV
jgi:asparagine synthase (glutamine-hydrolysing)